MTTLNWNVKLLGGLVPSDFSVWKAVAKIPECYNFTVTDSESGWAHYLDENGVNLPIPDEGNTLVITGGDPGDMFEPMCFPNHKCIMATESTDLATGTKILTTLMTSDGLLDDGVIGVLNTHVDMVAWIKRHAPEAMSCMNNISACTDPITGRLNDSEDALHFENAVCRYVLSTLGLCQN